MPYYKRTIAIVLMLMFSTTAHAAYYKQTIDGKVVGKACAVEIPAGEGWELIEGDPSLVEVWQEPQPTPYSSEELLTWAYQNILTQEPIARLTDAQKAVVQSYTTRFADNATNAGASLFRIVAADMGLSELAETIISKAIELGANIEEVE